MLFKDNRETEEVLRQMIYTVRDRVDYLEQNVPATSASGRSVTPGTRNLHSATRELTDSKERLIELEQQVNNMNDHIEEILAAHRRGSATGAMVRRSRYLSSPTSLRLI